MNRSLVIASAVGAYFKGGSETVTVWVSRDQTRAAPGGTGAAKCGGNYATSLVAQQEAIRRGYDQVVFLDAAERRWIEELGGMNIFFVFDWFCQLFVGFFVVVIIQIQRETIRRSAAHIRVYR